MMADRGGRHRQRSYRAWVVVGALVLLAAGLGGGVLLGRPAAGSTSSMSSAAAPGAPTVPVAGPPAAVSLPPSVLPPNSPAEVVADDASTRAYLSALDQAGVPVGANRAVVLSIGRGVCRQHHERNNESTTSTTAGQVMGLFPGVWTPEQARALVNCAATYFC